MPNLICLGCKLPGILDVLSHQVGGNVRGQVVEKEPRWMASHPPPGLGPSEPETSGRVQGMELFEALFEGFIRAVLRGILNEINYLGGVSTVESSNTVVELGYTAGQASDGKLGLGLGKPNKSVIRPELWKLDCTVLMSKHKQTIVQESSLYKCLENSANHTENPQKV